MDRYRYKYIFDFCIFIPLVYTFYAFIYITVFILIISKYPHKPNQTFYDCNYTIIKNTVKIRSFCL